MTATARTTSSPARTTRPTTSTCRSTAATGSSSFGCVGGTFKNSSGWGHGDSAVYVGGTPVQNNPKTTTIKNLDAYENVLGYSGTNSKYVVIKDSDVLQQRRRHRPEHARLRAVRAERGRQRHQGQRHLLEQLQLLPAELARQDRLQRARASSAALTLQYPTGIGVALFGSDGWIVKNNNIFGNFKWGVAMFSDPFNTGDDATSMNNQVLDNAMGRDGTDTNAVRLLAATDRGAGNCFQGNTSSTFRRPRTTVPRSRCSTRTARAPSPPNAGASGTSRAPEPGWRVARLRALSRRLRTARPAGEPAVLVDAARPPAVQGLRAARRHSRPGLRSVMRRALAIAHGAGRSWRRWRCPQRAPRRRRKAKKATVKVNDDYFSPTK